MNSGLRNTQSPSAQSHRSVAALRAEEGAGVGCLCLEGGRGRSVPAKRCTADLVAGDIIGDGRVEDGRAAQNHRHLTLHTQPTPFSRGERTRGRVVEARGGGPRPCPRPSALALPRTPSASRSACSRLSKISVKYAKISQNMPQIWSISLNFSQNFVPIMKMKIL